jgi:hypothetical protein
MDSLQNRIQSWFASFQSEIISSLSQAIHSTFERMEENPFLFSRNKVDSLNDIFRIDESEDSNMFVEYGVNYLKENRSKSAKEEKEKKLIAKLKSKNILLGHHSQYHVDSLSRQSISQSDDLFSDSPLVDQSMNAELVHVSTKEDTTTSSDSSSSQNEINEILEIVRTMMLTLIQHEEKIQQLQIENDKLKQEINLFKQSKN